MRSVRDILVHLMENEAGWAGHVIRGEPRRRFDPAVYGNLNAILAEWEPLRAATAAGALERRHPTGSRRLRVRRPGNIGKQGNGA
jgi:hypothetical protein